MKAVTSRGAHVAAFRRRNLRIVVTQDTAIARPKGAIDSIPGYRLVQVVGRGGMGEVHQAVQLSLGRTVAVKLLKPELANDEQFVGRFEKEGAALATLRHPNIVSIVDQGKMTVAPVVGGPPVGGPTYFLVMEFVDGPSLRERMRDPDFDVTQVLTTMVQITRAIDYAHHRGVIHRDLKPENILFDEQAGQLPKVTDFGLAGFDERHVTPRNLTGTHVAMGTASYMAPEQAVDARSAGPKADLYSLGVMLYEMLTGELPVGTFEMPSVKKPALDKRLDAIVSRCLKPAPEDRYPSATELLRDLEALAPVSTSFPSRSKETRVQRLVRRAKEITSRVGRVVGAALVAAAVAVLAALFLRARVVETRVSAGTELMTDFGVKTPLISMGRADSTVSGAVTRIRQFALGEGPDTVSIQALGRAPRVDHGTLRYDTVGDLPSGRAVLDLDVAGNGFNFSAGVDTAPTPRAALEPIWALFRGPRPDGRSALMVLGDHGRYVALVLSGSGNEPTLEWSLGEKRGVLKVPLPTTLVGQRVALRLDPESGDLFAEVGAGRDTRVLGDGLRLGSTWREVLSDSPRMAVGCLDAACAFHDVVVTGLEAPAPVVLAPPPELPKPQEGHATKTERPKPPLVVKAERPEPKKVEPPRVAKAPVAAPALPRKPEPAKKPLEPKKK